MHCETAEVCELINELLSFELPKEGLQELSLVCFMEGIEDIENALILRLASKCSCISYLTVSIMN